MKKSDGYVIYSTPDVAVSLRCVCQDISPEESLFVSDYKVTRCPKCGRGYRTECILWVYSPNEIDPEIGDKDAD